MLDCTHYRSTDCNWHHPKFPDGEELTHGHTFAADSRILGATGRLAKALRDIAAALNSTLDLDEVLDLILSTIGTIVPYDAVDITLLEGGVIRVVRHIGFTERGLADWISSLRFSLAEVANLKLYLRLLDSGRPEKCAQYMQPLQRETARLENLIEDLLYISRLDQSAQLHNVPLDLHPLIAEIIADRSDLAAKHGVTLDYLPNNSLPLALAGPGMFAQVITNLMSNAINYTPPGGLITLSTGMRTDDRHE